MNYKAYGLGEYNKKINKKQLSPVLLNRNSSNALGSAQKDSVRESDEQIVDAKLKLNEGSNKKKKYLNSNVSSTAYLQNEQLNT